MDQVDLGGLARPVEALDGDELAGKLLFLFCRHAFCPSCWQDFTGKPKRSKRSVAPYNRKDPRKLLVTRCFDAVGVEPTRYVRMRRC